MRRLVVALSVAVALLASALVLPDVLDYATFPNRSATNVGGLSDAECEDLLRRVDGSGGEIGADEAEQIQYCLRAAGGRGVPSGAE